MSCCVQYSVTLGCDISSIHWYSSELHYRPWAYIRSCSSTSILQNMNKIDRHLTTTNHKKTWTVRMMQFQQWQYILRAGLILHSTSFQLFSLWELQGKLKTDPRLHPCRIPQAFNCAVCEQYGASGRHSIPLALDSRPTAAVQSHCNTALGNQLLSANLIYLVVCSWYVTLGDFMIMRREIDCLDIAQMPP